MRGAIIISGEMRKPEGCVKTIEKLSEFCDLDVFVHAWDQVTWKVPLIKDAPEEIKLNIKKEKLDHKELIEKIKPKKILIEDKDALDPLIKLVKESTACAYEKEGKEFKIPKNYDKKVKYTNATCMSQFYSARKSYDTYSEYSKENNIEYDFIIKSRSDIEIVVPEKDQEDWFEEKIEKKIEWIKNCQMFEGQEGDKLFVFCPWVWLNNAGNPLIDWCLLFGQPKVFGLIYKDFPECLERWKNDWGYGGDGKKGGQMRDFGFLFQERKIAARGPLPFLYRIKNTDETGWQNER